MAALIDTADPRTFDFALEEGGRVYSIPTLAHLPFSFVRRMTTEGKEDSLAFALIDEFCPEIQSDPRFTVAAATAVFKAWKDAGEADGLTLGE